ncbi:hypothetical protein IMSAGC008_02024 [Muribaculaceae bacterium]|nr:hypothetical protein IMSAGC008_02024 [Muribaculaceae bacterium]
MTDSLPQQLFERRAVATGLSDGIRVEVKEGLDSVAVLRSDKIK